MEGAWLEETQTDVVKVAQSLEIFIEPDRAVGSKLHLTGFRARPEPRPVWCLAPAPQRMAFGFVHLMFNVRARLAPTPVRSSQNWQWALRRRHTGPQGTVRKAGKCRVTFHAVPLCPCQSPSRRCGLLALGHKKPLTVQRRKVWRKTPGSDSGPWGLHYRLSSETQKKKKPFLRGL